MRTGGSRQSVSIWRGQAAASQPEYDETGRTWPLSLPAAAAGPAGSCQSANTPSGLSACLMTIKYCRLRLLIIKILIKIYQPAPPPSARPGGEPRCSLARNMIIRVKWPRRLCLSSGAAVSTGQQPSYFISNNSRFVIRILQQSGKHWSLRWGWKFQVLIVSFIGLWFLLLLIASASIVVFLVTDPARSND